MKPPVACSRQRFVHPQPHHSYLFAQRRGYKKFVHNYNEEHGHHHTLAPKERAKTVRTDLFRITDELLDLDAYDSKVARPFSEDDEKQLEEQWGVAAVRKTAKARVEDFQRQIAQARQKAASVRTHSTTIWRLTPHDILMAALRRHASASPSTEVHRRRVVDNLRHENGIPRHAMADDESLIRWMLLRRLPRASPTTAELIAALKEMRSVMGVRRLLSRCLTPEIHTKSFAPRQGRETGLDETHEVPEDINLSQAIRESCLNILKHHSQSDAVKMQILTMIGNLSIRLSQTGLDIKAPLHGLALRLASDLANTEASWHYLKNGFSELRWSSSSDTLEDVLSALKSYSAASRLDRPYSSDRQSLLQLLTGVDESRAIAPVSLRTLVLGCLDRRTGTGGVGNQSDTLTLYQAYITLLGQLGAVRTLWIEWRESAPRYAKAEGLSVSSDQMATIFSSALQTLPPFTTRRNRADSPGFAMEDCVTLDFISMGLPEDDIPDQIDQDARIGSLPNPPIDARNVAAALDLPLNAWLERLGI